MATQQQSGAGAYRCPECAGDVAFDSGTWQCADCDFAPYHGAD